MDPRLRTLLTILLTLAASSADCQRGHIVPCVQGPVGVPTIVVTPAFPRMDQPVAISVSPGDYGSPTPPYVVFAEFVTASVSRQVIDVTMNGSIFLRPSPPRRDATCGVVMVNSLLAGVYTVNFLLNVRPLPLFVAASTTLAVSEPSLTAVPASSPLVVALMTLSILCFAYLQLRKRVQCLEPYPRQGRQRLH
jgi:hypothetical protein